MRTAPFTNGLRPCPFCGNVEKLDVQSKTGRTVWNAAETDCIYWERFSVRCPKCHTRGPVVSGWTSYETEPRTVNYEGKQTEVQPRAYYELDAMQAWNERADGGEAE